MLFKISVDQWNESFQPRSKFLINLRQWISSSRILLISVLLPGLESGRYTISVGCVFILTIGFNETPEFQHARFSIHILIFKVNMWSILN